MEITTGYNTFKHEHDAAKRPRDYKRLFGQKKVGPLCWKLVAENNREYPDFDWLLPVVESVNDSMRTVCIIWELAHGLVLMAC